MRESNAYINQDADVMEVWRAMVSQGENIPVVMPVRGISMRPLLKADRDTITVVPLHRELIRGDIIVFHGNDNKQYIVHRVREFTDSYIETIGDNRDEPDKRFTQAEVCGLVSHIRRKGRLICVDTPLWRCYGRIWMWMLPTRIAYRQKIKIPLRRLIRKIFGI